MLEQVRDATARLDELDLVGHPLVSVVRVGAGNQVAGLAHELIRGVVAGRKRLRELAGRTVLATDDVRRVRLLPADGVRERTDLHFELVETRFRRRLLFVFHCFLLGVGFLVDVFLVPLAGDGRARVRGYAGDGDLKQFHGAPHVHARVALGAFVGGHGHEAHAERIKHAVADQLHGVAALGRVAD